VARVVPLIHPGVAPTTGRGVQGAVVPAAENGVSLFELQTAIIRTG
jgi:hypothetical protein